MKFFKNVWFVVLCAATVFLSCKISASSSVPSKPTKDDYVGTWKGTGKDNSAVETVINDGKIWVTITDTNGDKTRPIDGAEYTVATDGTITVRGKDEDDAEVEYKLSIDENGNLVIKDGSGDEVANCGKTDTPVTEPEPLPPKEPEDPPVDPQVPTKDDYIGTWEATDSSGNKTETVITDGKIWVTIADTNDDKTRPIDGAEYTVADDGTITITVKDENGADVEYKLSIDENGNLVIKDSDGKKIADCVNTSKETPSEPPELEDPAKAKGGITLTFPAFTDMQDTITADATTVTKGTKVTLTLPNTYASYQWWLDSAPVSGATANSYEWNTSGASSGVHTIMCVVKTSAGKTYSAKAEIMVTGKITTN